MTKFQIDCIGDSITSGVKAPSYPRILQGLFNNAGMDHVQVNNRGKEGFTVGDYLSFLQEEPNASLFQKRDIGLIILLLGSNDTRDTVNTTVEDFNSTYRDFIQLLQTKTKHIFVMNIPEYQAPLDIFWKGQNHTFNAVDRINEELNPVIVDITKLFGINIIDIHTQFKENENKIYLDGIHPNPTGNKIIAETCYQSIQSIVSSISKE